MQRVLLRHGAVAIAILAITIAAQAETLKTGIDTAQIPKWSAEDLDFFLHESMNTEVVPERVLRAFIKIYDDLFPASDLGYIGFVADPKFTCLFGLRRKREVKQQGCNLMKLISRTPY